MNPNNRIIVSLRQPIWRFLILLAACCSSQLANASERPFIDLDQPLALLERSSIYQDISGQLALKDILGNDIQWRPNNNKQLSTPNKTTATWLKVGFLNQSDKNLYRYIAFNNPLFDFVDAYIYKNGQQIDHFQAGEGYPFHLRPIENRNFLFPLHIDKNDAIDLYFRLSDSYSGPIAITLISPDHYAGQDQIAVAGLALYAGFMSIIFIYYTAIFLVIRKAEFISYSVFVLCTTLFALTQHGLCYQFLWPTLPGWALISDPVLLILSAASGYWFLREFCHLKESSPFFYWVLSLFIVIQMILICGFILFDISMLFGWAINGLIPGLFFALYVVTALAFRGSSAAKSFALAWIFLSIGALLQIASSMGYIERNWFAYSGFMIGNIFYVLILSFSLAKLVQQMESDRLQAISLSKTKSEFFAKMSHELRTPIHGVLGLIELLIDTPMNAFQKRYINLMNVTGKSLLSVVNDLLDYSKIEAGEMTVNEDNFTLKELTEEVSAIFAHSNKFIDVPLRVDTAGIEGCTVCGDKEKIKQVLINLLSNAFKFTEKGEVTLKIVSDSSVKNNYIFSVKDTGAGISSGELEHLFDAFYQVRNHQSGDTKGTGLGLAISHQMVELMGGQISVKSKIGKGTSFTFTIPLKEPITEVKKIHVAESSLQNDSRSLNILVAEDNMTNQIVMQGMIKKLGHIITIVENGRDAVEILTQENHAFDLVFMDHDMPVMNGVDATIALRSFDGVNKDIIVIAMTAHNSEEIETKCLAAGMSDFLSKPVSISQLREKIASIKIAQF